MSKAKVKKGSDLPVEGESIPGKAADAAQVAVQPEAKPKAKAVRKKVAEPGAAKGATAKVVAAKVASPGSAATEAKPAKKVAKKAATKTAGKAKAEVAEAAASDSPAKAPKAKKTKGRDLVEESPAAAEVAEVLHSKAAGVSKAKAEESEAEDSSADEAGREPAQLVRLQKILAKAGISSRRKAEELILGGLVQINGKVASELGTKADPARDHIRVNGKLLQGPERIRYFVLNKPKGYVTTVSDPEGRPTVMQFFDRELERLYPVGRLDYLSEGLLLVTNDGDLANKLTKASSGVEKTYLVKVAGQPTEDMLDVLRAGVVIERGRPGTGTGRVRTAPAQIRQVRQGDNPWYEVIVIEGRNRELRKMFEEIGHHVEKIRRIGYGPLILDLEPGKMRELEPEEVQSLRLASEGKLKTRRRRGPAAAQLPTVAGKTVRYKKADGKPGFERPSAPQFKKEFKPAERRTVRPEFQQESKADFNPAFQTSARPTPRPPLRDDSRGGFKKEFKPDFKPEGKSDFKPELKRDARPDARPPFKSAGKPAFRPDARAGGRPAFGGKPRTTRPPEPPVTDYVLPPRKAGYSEPEDDQPSQPASPRTANTRPSAGRSDFDKPFRPTNPRSGRPAPPDDDDYVPTKTPGFRIEPVAEKPREERPRSGGFNRPAPGGRPFRPASGRPAGSSTGGQRPFRPSSDSRPDSRSDRGSDRAPGRGPGRPGASTDRPFRPRGEFRPGSAARPVSSEREDGGERGDRGERPARFTPRPGGSRPGGSRPGGPRPGGSRAAGPRTDGPPARTSRPAGRSFGAPASGAREDRPREFRPGTGGAAPKKFAGARPSGQGSAGRTGAGKAGPDGEPRKKERWRNSFTGKNKGRPKPKND